LDLDLLLYAGLGLGLGLEDRGLGLGLGFAGLVTSLIINKHFNFCCFRALAYTTLDRLCAVFLYTPCPEKKVPLIFLL